MTRTRSRFRIASAAASTLALGLILWAAPAQAGGGCHGSLFTDQRGISVDLKDACFNPTVLRIEAGAPITFTNRDEITHTVTGVAGSWGAYDEVLPGKSVTYRFADSGVYPYFCLLHPGMAGAVVVGVGTSSKTTSGSVAVPVRTSSLPPSAAAPQPAPVSASQGVTSAWRTAAILMFALLFATGLSAAIRRTAIRRDRAAAGA